MRDKLSCVLLANTRKAYKTAVTSIMIVSVDPPASSTNGVSSSNGPFPASPASRMPPFELPEVPSGNVVPPGAQSRTPANYEDLQDPWKLNPSFAYTPRKLKVFTIGAGFSGLLMAHKFQHRFPEMEHIVEHTIFEAHSEVGGTWLVNNYPGVQCDVPAHIYVSEMSLKAGKELFLL